MISEFYIEFSFYCGDWPSSQLLMSPYRAFDTLAKALNPGESTACQSSVEGMEGSVHLIAGDSSINYIEKEGPLLSDSHVAFRVFPCIYIYIFHNFYVVLPF